MDKFIFNEDLKRIFNCLTNKLVLSQYILKDFISDAKIKNDIKKKKSHQKLILPKIIKVIKQLMIHHKIYYQSTF